MNPSPLPFSSAQSNQLASLAEEEKCWQAALFRIANAVARFEAEEHTESLETYFSAFLDQLPNQTLQHRYRTRGLEEAKRDPVFCRFVQMIDRARFYTYLKQTLSPEDVELYQQLRRGAALAPRLFQTDGRP